MDSSTIHTQVTAQPQGGKAQNAPKGNAYGLFAQNANGQNFLDLLFGQIGQSSSAHLGNHTKTKDTTQTSLSNAVNPLQNTQTTLSQQTAINPLAETTEALIASEDNLDVNLDESIVTGLSSEGDLSLSAETSDLLEANSATEDSTTTLSFDGLTKLKDILDHLLQGTPGQELEITNIRHFLKNNHSLTAELNVTDGTDANLVATNLSPSELTDLLENLEEAGSYFIGLVKILPPKAQREKILLPRAILAPQNISSQSQNNNALNNLNGNPLAQQSAESDADNLLTPLVKGEAGSNGNTESILPKPNGFTKALEILGNLHNEFSSNEKPLQGINKAIENISSKITAGNSAVQSQGTENITPSPVSSLAGVFSTSLLDAVFPEGIDWASPSNQGQAYNVQSTMPLTSLVNNAPHAAAPHPTSQNVAATVTKMASTGETKNITIQLDPPDLGKVEVRFEFGKDKTVRANVLIEKPETHLMLQRDAHLLEKALQDAGLETDSNSLNFELSDDNYFDQQTNQDSEGHGQSQAGNSSEAENTEETIIESTMDIVIDPETGLSHVNILA